MQAVIFMRQRLLIRSHLYEKFNANSIPNIEHFKETYKRIRMIRFRGISLFRIREKDLEMQDARA
jgi:hypothetical protein